MFFALQALFFAIPIMVANMAPVLAKVVPFLNRPIDGGRLYKGQPILGSHKTWRGLIAACLGGMAAIYAQAAYVQAYPHSALPLIDYRQPGIYLVGFLMGFGAIVGDAVKSFLKRRVGKPSGAAWPPFDQIDFVIGGLLFVWPLARIPLSAVFLLLILIPIGHLLTNRIAFALGLKEVPY